MNAVLKKLFIFSLLSLPIIKPVYSEPINASQQAIEIEVNVLDQDINYDFGYDADDVNFVEGFLTHQGRTKGWFVLVNVHTDMPLNLTNAFDPSMRTLKWGIPYENAVTYLYTIGSSHDILALPRDWSAGQFRRNVSFVFIPSGKNLEFKIGYAASQQGAQYGEKSGYGMQVRLKGLPAGTVVITSKLVTESQNTKPKERKSYSLRKILEESLKEYNKRNLQPTIPMDLYDLNNYQYNFTSAEDVVGFHMTN